MIRFQSGLSFDDSVTIVWVYLLFAMEAPWDGQRWPDLFYPSSRNP